MVHIRCLLRPRHARKFPNRIEDYKQPSILVDDTPKFEVESILSRRVRKFGRGSRVEYLIRWKGYPPEEDTWEPLSNLTHCQEMLKSFHETPVVQINHIFVL